MLRPSRYLHMLVRSIGRVERACKHFHSSLFHLLTSRQQSHARRNLRGRPATTHCGESLPQSCRFSIPCGRRRVDAMGHFQREDQVLGYVFTRCSFEPKLSRTLSTGKSLEIIPQGTTHLVIGEDHYEWYVSSCSCFSQRV